MSEKTEVYDLTTTEPVGGTPPTAEVKPSITVYRPQFDENLLKPGTAILVRAGKSSWNTYNHHVNAIITSVAALELTVVYYGPALDRYSNHHDSSMEERNQIITIDELTSEMYQIEVIQEAKS